MPCFNLVAQLRIPVEARSELDLRIGYAFSRFQTGRFKNKFAGMKDLHGAISFGTQCITLFAYLLTAFVGPCQFPTLGFVVDRYKEIADFQSENFWYIEVSVKRGTLLGDALC